jgi:hypothetical protein
LILSQDQTLQLNRDAPFGFPRPGTPLVLKERFGPLAEPQLEIVFMCAT